MYDIDPRTARSTRAQSRPRRAPRPGGADLSWLPPAPLDAEERRLVEDLRALIDLGLIEATTDLGHELRLALAADVASAPDAA